jgi:hypothetical protein
MLVLSKSIVSAGYDLTIWLFCQIMKISARQTVFGHRRSPIRMPFPNAISCMLLVTRSSKVPNCPQPGQRKFAGVVAGTTEMGSALIIICFRFYFGWKLERHSLSLQSSIQRTRGYTPTPRVEGSFGGPYLLSQQCRHGIGYSARQSCTPLGHIKLDLRAGRPHASVRGMADMRVHERPH